VASTTVGPGIRVGIGRDSHPFGPGDGLRLGGIDIDAAPRLHGHSDGDVALHAIAGALLEAAGLGDLGRLFPADSRTPRGVSSRGLLEAVIGLLATEGWRAASVGVSLTAARPRLGGRLDDMRAAIAALVGLDLSLVSVEAGTGNLSGDEGAGRAISAMAIATIVPSGGAA
jgi:2-C-methyl-D-erythritol 2,4-cyclodiphosphate synthase